MICLLILRPSGNVHIIVVGGIYFKHTRDRHAQTQQAEGDFVETINSIQLLYNSTQP